MTDDTRIDNPSEVNRLYDLLKKERYTPEEAAEVLNMKQRVILSAAFGGDLKAEIINGDVISVSRTALVAWLQWRENN